MTVDQMQATLVMLGWQQIGTTWFKPLSADHVVVVTWDYAVRVVRHPRTIYPPIPVTRQHMENVYAKAIEYEETHDG